MKCSDTTRHVSAIYHYYNTSLKIINAPSQFLYVLLTYEEFTHFWDVLYISVQVKRIKKAWITITETQKKLLKYTLILVYITIKIGIFPWLFLKYFCAQNSFQILFHYVGFLYSHVLVLYKMTVSLLRKTQLQAVTALSEYCESKACLIPAHNISDRLQHID